MGSRQPGVQRAARGGRERGQGCVCLPSPAVGVPRASPAGVPRLESSWHGRPTLEKERERNSAAPNRRAQKVMIRSSSDSSYVSGSPGGSPVSGSEQQPSDPEVHTPSPSLSPVQEPGTLPVAPSRPPQESPPRPGVPHSHPPLRLKKSFEVLVRKPTTSKPKPPPRKYFKSDSDPQKSLEERENSPCPSGPTLPACGQVRGRTRRMFSRVPESGGAVGFVVVVGCFNFAFLHGGSRASTKQQWWPWGGKVSPAPSDRRGSAQA